jgi:hypothetical protein
MPRLWKKGRGKLGFLEPLIGRWTAKAETPIGPVACTRIFEHFGSAWIRLEAKWEFPSGAYQEIAVIGPGDDGIVGFWSFTSDGKRSQGMVTDATDVHAEAVGFEAQMPAGIARMVYWPHDVEGFHWAVESKTKKGWRRFTEHHYHAS